MNPCLGNFHISVCKSYIKVYKSKHMPFLKQRDIPSRQIITGCLNQRWYISGYQGICGNLAAFGSVNSLIIVGYEILTSKSQGDFIHFTLQLAAWLTDLGLDHPMALEPHLLHNLTNINLRKQMQVGVYYEQFKEEIRSYFIKFDGLKKLKRSRNKICFNKTKWISNNLLISISEIFIVSWVSFFFFSTSIRATFCLLTFIAPFFKTLPQVVKQVFYY